MQYLELKNARCKDCYKCLRECPVKAISYHEHQARIIEDRCILCGHCTTICPQNAKVVHSELDDVKALLASGVEVVASVAPSFISSFRLKNFGIMKLALAKVGFADSEETAIGAQAVTEVYREHLLSGDYDNYISSACPAVCRMIQIYYPKALKYLAPVDSPMVAHAKMLHAQRPKAKIVFLGPCIAKKREGRECGLVSNVLTFEDMEQLFAEHNIDLAHINDLIPTDGDSVNLAKLYPVSHGIIGSFGANLPKGYEYMAVDGPDRCADALAHIEDLHHVFLEINMCKDACVNGPCSLDHPGGSITATSEVREYVSRESTTLPYADPPHPMVNIAAAYPRLHDSSMPVSEQQIEEILHHTGKITREDELNCGACGYNSCRQKAWAVYNGFASIEICLPYMRSRAESLSFEVIQNSPEGVIVLDSNMNIVDVNSKARELLGIKIADVKGHAALEYFKPIDFMVAYNEKRHVDSKNIFIIETQKYIDLSVNYLEGQNVLFGIMKDVTDDVNYDKQLSKVKMETLKTTDKVIKKQMRVAQEIASLLGETTAETKVALLKLKQYLTDEEKGEQR